MKPFSENKKLWWLALYFYIAPLLANVFFVLQSGHLLGDFTHILLDPDPLDLLVVTVVYLVPLAVITSILHIDTRLDTCFSHPGYTNFLFYLLLIVGAFTLIFGAIPVGAPPTPGITGLVQTIIIKFNPYLLLILLSALRVQPWKMAVGGLCVLLMGIAQKSLLGYFVLVMAFSLYLVVNNVHSRRHFLFVCVIPIIIIIAFQDLMSYLYDLRNQSRGESMEISEELIISYAIGRINSFSSLYQIVYDDCCGAVPSTFYAIYTFLERITGLGIFSNTTPGQTYNEFLLGSGAEYSIFTSTAGAALISFKSSLLIFGINVVTLLAILKIMYILLPTPSGPRKLPLFLIVLYLPYLSGDVWELSLLFQSIVILRIIYWLSLFLGNRFANGNVFMKSSRGDTVSTIL